MTRKPQRSSPGTEVTGKRSRPRGRPRESGDVAKGGDAVKSVGGIKPEDRAKADDLAKPGEALTPGGVATPDVMAPDVMALCGEPLRDLCASVPIGMFVADSSGRWVHCNELCTELLGATSDQAGREFSGGCSEIPWLSRVHPSDRQRVEERWFRFLKSGGNFSEEFRLRHPDGSEAWVQVDAAKRLGHGGASNGVVGTVVSTSAHKETEQFLELENDLLEAVASGLSLQETLLRLVRFIERQSSDMIASVLLRESDGMHLRHGAAPSLDPEYNELVDGISIGEGVGSCGTAAHRGEPVFVEDIELDPLWHGVRHLARKFGLRACWSTPLKDRSGEVLGTFAVYRSVPGGPTARHLRIIDVASHLASIVLERHRDDQKLVESERRFRRLFEHAAVGVAQLESMTGEILRVNQRYCEILGRRESDLLGKTCAELTHPADVPASEWQMARLLSGEIREFVQEKRIQREGDTYIWVNLTVSAMWPSGGEPTTYSVIVEDITERKQAEEALRLSEERFRSLVQTAPFGVLRTDPDGRITFANAALGSIYDCSPGDLIDCAVWDLALNRKDRQWMMDQMRRGGQSVSGSATPAASEGLLVKHRTQTGRVIDVHIDWAAERNREDEKAGSIVVISDVTTRREFERQLEFQADVLNRVSDAVIVTDQHHAVTYANEAAERMFEISNDHRSGRTLLPLHEQLLVKGVNRAELLAELDRSGQWQGELELQVEGRDETLEVKLKAFRSPNSDGNYLLSLVRDISTRKLAEQERRQHRDALAHMTRLSTMGELVAGVAHEVRQPLYAIANFVTATSISLRNLSSDAPIDNESLSDLTEFNDGVRRASQRANEIIQRLREFARKSDQARKPININQVIRDSIDLVAFEARQCDAIVTLELKDPLPDVIGDRIQCEQVLVNLLHNAYEALEIVERPRRVTVRTRDRGECVEIEVEDNGPGIAQEQLSKIFEAFCTTKPAGMGMGLAISRTIVEDHGGRLSVSTNHDGGATFLVSLPVATRSAQKDEAFP